MARIERIIGEVSGPAQPLARIVSQVRKYLKVDNSATVGIVPEAVTYSGANLEQTFTPGADLVVNFFGNCSVFASDERLILKGKKANSILYFLLYESPGKVCRDALIDRFWPYHSFEAGKNCLNVTIHSIRKAFKEIGFRKDVIVFKNDCYQINSDLVIEFDHRNFELNWRVGTRHEQAERVAEAVNCYRKAFAYYSGAFAANLKSEEWCELKREKFKEQWLILAIRLCSCYLRKNKLNLVIDIAQKILKEDACMEEAHKYLMRCYSKMGLRSQAIRQYEFCRQRLWSELKLLPEQETEKLYQSLRGIESGIQPTTNTDHLS